jgi:predicted ATP-dependent endonuclease of OLD family
LLDKRHSVVYYAGDGVLAACILEELMYLKKMKLQNYRLFEEADISFQHGMNVLIGKNSTGKSTVLEAIDFLLSNNNANIPAEEIIPYSMRNQKTVQARIDGYFEMSDIEKDSVCSILKNPNDHVLIKNSHMEIVYTKIIRKSGKNILVTPNVQVNGNSISNNPNILNQIIGSILPKMQTNNLIRVTDFESDNNPSPLLPINQLIQMAPHQSSFLNQYVRNALYDMKQGNVDEFDKIKTDIIKSYPEMADMDIEFDPKRAQVQIYFKMKNSDIKIPLESEGLGIREFLYLLLTLHYFPDTIILKDEALTHMHKSLLSDFIAAIDGLQYQMITTSHIKELIRILDFGNIIICRKCNGKVTIKNLMQLDEIDKALEELGYPIEAIPDIDNLIQEN